MKDTPPERDEAERLLAELRERETDTDQKPGREGTEASAAAGAKEAEESRATAIQGKRVRWRSVNPNDRRVEVVALGPKAAAAYGRQALKRRADKAALQEL